MRKLSVLLALLIFAAMQAVFAQRTITGTVISDDDSNPIPGVAITVKGTTQGVTTNIDGKLGMMSTEGKSSVRINAGEMGALVDTFSSKIPAYQEKLNSVITQLVTSVNEIHNTGYNNDDPAQEGFDFFEVYDGNKLKIRREILNDYNKIAASADGTSGNGDIAIKINGIGDAKLINGSKLGDFYSALISEVGSNVQNAERMAESGSLVLQQLHDHKDSISAVSVLNTAKRTDSFAPISLLAIYTLAKSGGVRWAIAAISPNSTTLSSTLILNCLSCSIE